MNKGITAMLTQLRQELGEGRNGVGPRGQPLDTQGREINTYTGRPMDEPDPITVYGEWCSWTHWNDMLPTGNGVSTPAKLAKDAEELLQRVASAEDATPAVKTLMKSLTAATKAYVEAYAEFYKLDQKFADLAWKARDRERK